MRGTKRKAAPNTAAVSVASISDVPNPIVCDILSRLPLNSIFTCKRVSKAWRDLILDPHFERLHLSRSPLSLFFFRNGDINNIYNSNSASSHFEIFQLHDPPVLEHYNATMKFKTEVYFSGMRIAASCNGLILLANWSDGRVIVCNPLRAQHFILPKPPNTVTDIMTPRFGFGHSPATDQYKVLRFYYLRHSPSILGFDIYTVGIDDKWRSLGYPRQPTAVALTLDLVFLNGAFHWLGFENRKSWFICYFDIEKELFGSFPLPSHIRIVCPYLGVVDNWLYIKEVCSLDVQKVWVMKDYGEFSSWTLEYVIEGARFGTAKPLKMLKDGTLLMMFNKIPENGYIKITLASYNPQTRVLKKIKHCGDLNLSLFPFPSPSRSRSNYKPEGGAPTTNPVAPPSPAIAPPPPPPALPPQPQLLPHRRKLPPPPTSGTPTLSPSKRRPPIDVRKGKQNSKLQKQHNCIPDEHYVQTLFAVWLEDWEGRAA
ncbi:hypothetical protein RHGRI_005622 [Rhododendron griersonianum]|uniref:F-box domain-containing protein n=1 Tax=Rhododendron griersonianum TaxID=479676 RepID=A0AAV6LCZ1_9ERIC|nr:hypothetical protein RHGRI_005622 [Rhododendron griersonianum]